jgi:hypothetical protein
MRTRALFLSRFSLCTCLMVLTPSLAMGAHMEVTTEDESGIFTVHGIVQDEVGRPIVGMPLLCWWDAESRGRQAISKEEGRFTLIGIPHEAKALRCWTPGGDTYVAYEDQVSADARSAMIITVGLKSVPTLEGVITNARGKPIPHALVEVTDALGVTVKAWANEHGQVLVKNLKAGAGTIRYVADGYQEKPTGLQISERANLSMVLLPASTPVGLLLLIPGIVVLASRAAVDLVWGTRAERSLGRRSKPKLAAEAPLDPNAWLAIASLASWGVMFCVLWLWMRQEKVESLTFFDTGLSFSLFIPACGFLGALVFVIDLFQRGRQEVNAFREFAMRLVLAPYVAIIIVIFFGGTFTFIQLTNLQAQAALAFFSGFLVVLFLQGLTERGNEVLGQWRSDNRYEPSEIARRFDLEREEDLKLRKANLKYLAQLQALPEADLRVLGRQTDLGEGFLVALQRRVSPERLHACLGQETWATLSQEGVRTVWDVALLTPERLEQIAKNHHLDHDVWTKFHEACQAFVEERDHDVAHWTRHHCCDPII